MKGACSDPQPLPQNFFYIYKGILVTEVELNLDDFRVKWHAQDLCSSGEISEKLSWKL